ncbi:MAG: chemotaxis protein CheW [Planctomycetota bacterium]
MADTKQYCTFYIGRQYFGLDVLKVQEVVRHQPLTRVPLAPPTVRGLINLRGQIVTAIDAHRRLELPRDGELGEAVNVVVQGEDGAYSLQVDEIGDVLEVPLEQFEPPPVTLPLKRLDLILGVYKLDNRLLIILDPTRIVEPPESFTPTGIGAGPSGANPPAIPAGTARR